MSREEQEKREVLALVSWLQTFDRFPFSVVDGVDGENVKERFNIALESLENCKISRAVVHVAEEVCDMRRIEVGVNPSADEIWRILLHITTTKSRFEIYTTPNNVKSNAEIPHVVLSNLLDFAVTSPDLDDRRKYIERIMSLSKSVQKILMNLIERMKKTLPRKPKNSSSSQLPKSIRSPRALCGRNDHTLGSDAHIPNTMKPVVKKCAPKNNPNGDDDMSEESDVTPPPQEREPPQRHRSFGTPKRERNIHGIPQSEPRVPNGRPRSASRERPVVKAPLSDQRPRSRSSSRMRQHESEEPTNPRQPEGRQPEGHYLSALEKKRNQKGFTSPPRDRQQQRKPKGFTSPSKPRHSTGTINGQPPFRERQVQAQRAAFVSINNQNSKNGYGIHNKKGIPPPPPPPYPPSEQKMPATSTPSDELEIDNHMSIPLTDTTTSTATASSSGTSTELAVLKLNGSGDKLRPSGKVMSLDKKRQGDIFSTPTRRSTLAGSKGNQTPDTSLAMYERDADSRMMFSPDDSVLQSPMQVDDFVKELRAKNKSLESILQSYQKRERELSQKMESTESKLRKEMMKLESRALGREDELRCNYEDELAKLKKDLRTEKERNKESKRAKEELANANDELDLMQHTHEKLLEATEKIRKYKERLDSMSDFKEALEREQEAHSKSVNECVRLQNELKFLQPLKRQLDDYKAKSVEMEVELAECKDALSRLERERDELAGARNDVIKEAQAQKAQAEELRKFIRVEEKNDGPGIGEGISELNPELQEELIKLRNENEKLRAFADQRTDDSVQKLQENLEDSTLRQERFKDEFLKKKNKLEDTVSLLAAARQKLAELEVEIEQKDQKAEEYENRLKTLEDHYTACLEDLEGLQELIDELEGEKSNLQTDLAEWKEMADKLEAELQKRSGDLEDTKTRLEEAEGLNRQLEADVTEWKLMSEKLEAELQRRVTELETTKESMGASEEEKARVESDLAEWKQMATKLETELVKKNEELEATRKTLVSMEEEKKGLANDVNEWRQIVQKLEEDLKSQTNELAEARKQLRQTEKALHDAEERHGQLLHRLGVYEGQVSEKEEENENLSRTLMETCNALKAAEAAVEEAGRRETTLNEECREKHELSEQLLDQLKEEKKAKKALIEENHRTLEATREVLNCKAKKELEELQKNMNDLLDDERKAYRVKNEKAQIDLKKLEEKYTRKLQEAKDEAAANLKSCEEESLRRLMEQEAQSLQEIESVRRQAKEKLDDKIERSEKMLEECMMQAKEEWTKVVDEKHEVSQALQAAEAHGQQLVDEKHELSQALQAAEARGQQLVDEKHELSQALQATEAHGQQLAGKNSKLKKMLEVGTQKINELESEQDDLCNKMKKLERQNAKVEEENERYRRQLGGRYGVDGQMQNQLDKLNKELMEAHNDNRDLKRKLAEKISSEDMATSFDVDSSHTGYSRGAVNTHAIAQIRSGYEEQIANLNDEKRELVMKNSAAITDVQKAEQLVWDREKEIDKIQQEKLSLEVKLKRAQMASAAAAGGDVNSSFYSQAKDMSFTTKDLSFVMADGSHDLHYERQNQRRPETFSNALAVAPSSSVDTDERALSPIKNHDNQNNSFNGEESSRSPNWSPARKSNPYEMQLKSSKSPSAQRPMAEKSNDPYALHLGDVKWKPQDRRQSDEHQRQQQQQHQPELSIVDYTQIGSPEIDEPNECNQS